MTGPVAFLGASALVCASATVGVSLLRLRSLVDMALAWALLASTIVVATLLLAGAVLDDLTVWLVLLLSAAVLGLLGLVWLALGYRSRSSPSRWFTALRLLLPELCSDPWLLVLLAVATGEVLWRLVIAYLMPPYANDALWYHLTTVAGWLQAGRIGPSQLSIWSTVYPHNGELLLTWPALLLGDDTFVDAVQLPFAVVGGLAVAGIGRTVGLSRRGAAAAGCLFLLSPIVLSQTTASYTDLIFIGFFLTAFHFLLRFLADLRVRGRGARRTHLFLAGLGGGLALGTKDLGIVYVGVISLLLVAHLLAARLERRLTGTSLGLSLVVFGAPLLVLGSYHYVETWVRFGNPFYPVRIAAFGIEFFRGRSIDWFLNSPQTGGLWWRQVWDQWNNDYFFLVRPRFHAYSYDDRTSGLGPLWSYLGLPLLIVFALRLAWTNRVMFLSLLLPVATMFALQPYRWWSRFTMILIAVGVIAVVAFVEALPHRWSIALKMSVLGLVALGVFFPTFKIDGEFWASRIARLARLPAHERTVGRVALPGYRWVDQTAPRATIGVDTSAAFLGAQPYILAYPLFGPHLDHRVYPLPEASQTAFERALTQKRIRYVFVHRAKRLDRWTGRAVRAGCAQRIYDGPVYAGQWGRAYRFVPGCAWIRAY